MASDLSSDLDRKIVKLRKASKDTLTFIDKAPLENGAYLLLLEGDLSIIKLSTSELHSIDDLTLYKFLSSNIVLPCLKQFKEECIDNPRLKSSLDSLLINEGFPYQETTEVLARLASKYAALMHQKSHLEHPHSEVMEILAKHIRRLKRRLMTQPMHFLLKDRYSRLDELFYKLCIRTLLTVCVDMQEDPTDGFFSVLFDTEYDKPMSSKLRSDWDNLLLLPSGDSGANTAASVVAIQAAFLFLADGNKKSNEVPFGGEEADQNLQAEIMAHYCKLHTDFVKAASEIPELVTTVPSENGQTESQKPKLVGELVGFPPKQKLSKTNCVRGCQAHLGKHNVECPFWLEEGKKMFIKTLGEGKADGLDLENFQPSFTFQVPLPADADPKQIKPRLNCKNHVDPFSEEETLLAFKMFKVAMKPKLSGTLDLIFPWTSISEVFVGRGVADIIHFYDDNKRIIDSAVNPTKASAPAPVLDATSECTADTKGLQKDLKKAQIKAEDCEIEKEKAAKKSAEKIQKLEGDNDYLQKEIRQQNTEIQELEEEVRKLKLRAHGSGGWSFFNKPEYQRRKTPK